MADYDVVVVGGGHNGLIAAAYVARAGLKVAVLERCAHLGGAAATVELWPGHHVDVGAGTQVVLPQTGIVEELGLAEHGLKYLEYDPMYVAFFPDGTAIHFWRDLDRTCESIARLSPRDAENYRHFVETWLPVAPFFLDLFGSPPSLAGTVRHLGAQLRRAGPGAFEFLGGLAASPRSLLRKYFRDPRLQAALAFSAAQTGVPTATRGAGASLLWFAIGHKWGNPVPLGGSGALAEALGRKLNSLGADVLLGESVAQVRSVADGVEVTTGGGRTLSARAAIMATHLRTTLRLLSPELLPSRVTKRLSQVDVGNGCGVTLHLVTDSLPRYPALPDGGAAANRSIQTFCPSPEYLDQAYADFRAGRPARQPAVSLISASAFDPTRAPAGHHVLSLWAQWYPYELAGGQRWEDLADAEAERILDTVAPYAPGLRASVREIRFNSPVALERELDLARANLMHLPMTPDRLLVSRPARGYSNYRLRPGVYLTGASTHPGGGVLGVSGRLAAGVVLSDLRREEPRLLPAAPAARAS